MQAYDFIVLLLLVVATVWGARRGLAKQLATLASLVLGYIVAVNFREPVAAVIQAPHPWDLFAAMLGLFVATSLAIWVAFRFVNGTIEKTGLRGFDVQMGGLLGLAKGFIIAMAVTMFSVVMLGDAQRSALLGSFSGYNICRLLNQAHSIVPAEWQQVMQPYFETVAEHQQLVNQPRLDTPPSEEYPDPFEAVSPSDLPSRYDDARFGNLPTRPVQQQDQAFRNRSAEGWNAKQPQSQATLQDSLFDSRR